MAFVGAFSAAFSRLKGAGAASSLKLLVEICNIQKLYLVWISRDKRPRRRKSNSIEDGTPRKNNKARTKAVLGRSDFEPLPLVAHRLASIAQ